MACRARTLLRNITEAVEACIVTNVQHKEGQMANCVRPRRAPQYSLYCWLKVKEWEKTFYLFLPDMMFVLLYPKVYLKSVYIL